jgi:hypothetical protein
MHLFTIGALQSAVAVRIPVYVERQIHSMQWSCIENSLPCRNHTCIFNLFAFELCELFCLSMPLLIEWFARIVWHVAYI